MTATRKNAIITGVLFIMATVFGVITASIYNPILSQPDYLSALAGHQDQILIGTLLYFAMAMCCAGVGLSLYPIIKQYSEGLAIGSAGFRIIEGMLQVIGAIFMVCLLALSREAVQSSGSSASYLQSVGGVIRSGSDWISNSAMLLSWGIAAVLYYYAFYKFRLVPRWLSLWGLIGISLTIVSSVMMMFDSSLSNIQTIANMPIALQEMVLAVWIIVKGFSLPKYNH